MTKEQIASTAMNSVNLGAERTIIRSGIRKLDKAEEIAFPKARKNGLKQKNGCMAREIANNEQNISNIHEKVMVLEQELEEELWWQRFINYCNRFC
ncbi:MAG: hypothetical protein KAR12_11630 [Methylococcales bacterium]|nr:hypothetical protein [Methylococcales bacterium]